jgi:hypothetical protein
MKHAACPDPIDPTAAVRKPGGSEQGACVSFSTRGAMYPPSPTGHFNRR